MSTDFRTKISDVCQLGDGAHASVTRVLAGVPYLTSKNIGQGELKLDQMDFISEEDYNRLFPPASKAITRLHAGDVLTGIIGTFSNSYVYKASDSFGISSAIAILRPDQSRLRPQYLYYHLNTPHLQSLKESVASGSVQGYTNLTVLGSMPIRLPPLQDQEAITEVLGALDDKIAANTKRGATAKNLAEAHFLDALRGATDQAVLGDVLALEYGKSLPASTRKPGNVDVYGSGGISGTHNQALCEGPGVVVGRKGTAGAVHWSRRPFFPIDTTFYVVPRVASVSQIFSYFLLRTLRLDEMNNDSAVPGLNRNEAHASKIRVPAEDRLNAFTDTATVLFDLAASGEDENESLAATRDLLLPQLMSGKLRVKDAEKVLANAGV